MVPQQPRITIHKVWPKISSDAIVSYIVASLMKMRKTMYGHSVVHSEVTVYAKTITISIVSDQYATY